MIDILIVTYKPVLSLMRTQLDSLSNQGLESMGLNLYVWENSDDPRFLKHIKDLLKDYDSVFLSKRILSGPDNIGFGPGNNRLLSSSSAPWVLISNQEIVLEPNALKTLIHFASEDDEGCAWEMRQIPYEHPKVYDPVTLETPWVSGAACLYRRQAIEQVNGFEEKIFMYGEDVDLSWRLRAKGWRLRYIAKAAVIHHTYSKPKEVKPLQAIEGNLTNLCLRARFGSWGDILKGLAMLSGELFRPEIFPGRRKSLALNFVKYFKRFPYYRWKTGVRVNGFKPTFLLWDFSERRDGAFHEFKPSNEKKEYPLVSILVRTCHRPQWLREALLSIKYQTYPNIEVVIVEDGPPTAQKMIETEFQQDMNIKYFATKEPVGRSRAGNIALEMAGGEWFNFLDDDDVFFSDHVEVLLQSAIREKIKGVYALAWETETRVVSELPLKYIETDHYIRHNQQFCRITLWHHNYMPIQSVLFHRSLYERWGGLEEDMDQLEDWNLWTRYSLEDRFALVEKCTSKYRVPSNFAVQLHRQNRLDLAYEAAVEKQKEMTFASHPQAVLESIEDYIGSQIVFMVTIDKCRKIMAAVPYSRGLFRLMDALFKRSRFWHTPFRAELTAPTNEGEPASKLKAREFFLPLQQDRPFTYTPRIVINSIEAYLRNEVVAMLTVRQLRQWSNRFIVFRLLFRRLVPFVKRVLKIFGKYFEPHSG
jgi:GT2 family glycosyltransferase